MALARISPAAQLGETQRPRLQTVSSLQVATCGPGVWFGSHAKTLMASPSPLGRWWLPGTGARFRPTRRRHRGDPRVCRRCNRPKSRAPPRRSRSFSRPEILLRKTEAAKSRDFSSRNSTDLPNLQQRRANRAKKSARSQPQVIKSGSELPIRWGKVHFLLCVCFGKVKSDPRSNQLITFTRFFEEALPINYRDLPAAALNRTCAFQLAGSIRDGWPLNTQHFGEKALGNRQYVAVTAVTHHEQPARQPLLEAVRTVARHRHQDLLEKGVNVSGHEISEGRHRLHRPRQRPCATSWLRCPGFVPKA